MKGVYFLLAQQLRRRPAHEVAWIEDDDPEALEAELILALRAQRVPQPGEHADAERREAAVRAGATGRATA